jgi:hypothetical protein
MLTIVNIWYKTTFREKPILTVLRFGKQKKTVNKTNISNVYTFETKTF